MADFLSNTGNIITDELQKIFQADSELFCKFAKEVLNIDNITDNVVIRHGVPDIDLLITDENNVIAVENIIKSDIYSKKIGSKLLDCYNYVNGLKKDNAGTWTEDEGLKSRFQNKQKHFYIFAPNYIHIDTSKIKYVPDTYKVITYSQIYDFYKKYESSYSDKILCYEKLLNSIYNSSNGGMRKKILLVISAVIVMLVCYVGGIFTANSDWFNDIFYIKSRQMESLTPKSVRPYDIALFKKADTQYDLNMASSKRYEQYHKYFEKVTKRIRNYDFADETVKKSVVSYLDGYEERKAQMLHLFFPKLDKSDNNVEYGSMFPMSYASAMVEIDRQELLTYRMILANIYSFISIQDINAMFED